MSDDALVSIIRQMDERFQRLTGRAAFGYVAAPTRTSVRVTFHDGTVCLSLTEARDYMASLVWLAEHEPKKLPYPFDQDLPREWDLRVINGWDGGN